MLVTERIAAGEFKNIIVVTGAGISTNAGIPDYRSKTGIFAELMKEFPQARRPDQLFSRDFIIKYNVHEHPLYRERIQSIRKVEPTSSHILCKWLNDKGWLKRVYTQNIDGLHQKTGLSSDKVVEYHGSILKNNVVLYGDSISSEAIYQTIEDFSPDSDPVDLIIVMGTSLQVAPFCAIPNLVTKECTRILVDLHPENAFTNEWTPKKIIIEGMYDTPMRSHSNMKIGKRLVSFRPQWGGRIIDSTWVGFAPPTKSKWKKQYIIRSDTDSWSNLIMA